MRKKEIKHKKKENEFAIALELAGKKPGGLSVNEFVEFAKIVEMRHGPHVMIGQPDKDGKMHLSKNKKHLGYVDLKTGSLIWDPVDGVPA